MAEPIDLPFGLWTQVGQSLGERKEAHIQSYSPGGANVPATVQSYVTLL